MKHVKDDESKDTEKPIIFFKFFFGSFFGSSYYLLINFDVKYMQYGVSDHGGFFPLKDNSAGILEPDNFTVKSTDADEELLDGFMQSVKDCGIKSWEEAYNNPNILDGVQWNIEMQQKGSNKTTISGYNAYPPEWSRFMRAVKNMIEKIETGASGDGRIQSFE